MTANIVIIVTMSKQIKNIYFILPIRKYVIEDLVRNIFDNFF